MRLTTQPGEPGSLAWSPDGSDIAYDAYRPGRGRDIHLVETATGRSRRLTSDRGDEISPVWSPDGRTIAFEHSPVDGGVDNAGSYDIYAMSPDGHGRRRLTRCRCALGGGLSWQRRPAPDRPHPLECRACGHCSPYSPQFRCSSKRASGSPRASSTTRSAPEAEAPAR